jgi:hypothetical protein
MFARNITRLEIEHITILVTISFGGVKNTHEIKELSRIICNNCEEKEYEKCRGCRIYQLVNRIANR